MEDDEYAYSFSASLFTDLWYEEKLIPHNNCVEPKVTTLKFVQDVSMAVRSLSSIISIEYDAYLDIFFEKHGMHPRSIFAFMATYSFKYHETNPNIFCVFLKTCVFVYRAALYCHKKTLSLYLTCAAMAWSEIFKYDLKKEFYEKGGWDELERYLAEKFNKGKLKDLDVLDTHPFFDDIHELFSTLNISEDENCSQSVKYHIYSDSSSFLQGYKSGNCTNFLPDSLVSGSTSMVQSMKFLYQNEMERNFQHSDIYLSQKICEANVSAEEAVSAYNLMTAFYGTNGIKSLSDNVLNPEADLIDMEHIYNTITNCINQGLLQIESSTGKLYQPSTIPSSIIQKSTLSCSNCQHEASNISNGSSQLKILPSSILQGLLQLQSSNGKLIHNDSVYNSESHETTQNCTGCVHEGKMTNINKNETALNSYSSSSHSDNKEEDKSLNSVDKNNKDFVQI